MANPFFNVGRTPAFAEIGGEKVDIGKDILFREDDGKQIGIVSKDYKVVENAEVAKVFDDAFADIQVQSVKDHLNGTLSSWRREIIVDDPRFTYAVKGEDITKLKINIFNGYNPLYHGRSSAGYEITAWRQVCSNGMMGWSRAYGLGLAHLYEDAIDRIRSSYDINVGKFQAEVNVWKEWTEIPFTEEDFGVFIDTRKGLSDKMKDNYKGFFVPTLEKYGDDETKWGAYNVLTAIASHEVKARSGSPVFSAGYKRMGKLCKEMYNYLPEKKIALAM